MRTPGHSAGHPVHLGAPAALAADSTITISGYVRDNACAVAGESKDFTVDLQDNAAKQFYAAGATTPPVPFRIVLSPCRHFRHRGEGRFHRRGDSVNTSLLKLDAGPRRRQEWGWKFSISSSPAARSMRVIHHDLDHADPGPDQYSQLYARLMATQVPVTAGHVNATATFTLEFQ